MNDHLVAVKTAIVAGCTALSAFLGWKGILAIVWVACMALDYISGTLAACKEGHWSSAVARQGLWHKGGMILVVAVAAIADGIMAVICANLNLGIAWPAVILPLVLAWYIITELGSILENAVKLGAKVPNWLVKVLKVSLKAVDAKGATMMIDSSGNHSADNIEPLEAENTASAVRRSEE